jgi:hypothetical protein
LPIPNESSARKLYRIFLQKKKKIFLSFLAARDNKVSAKEEIASHYLALPKPFRHGCHSE